MMKYTIFGMILGSALTILIAKCTELSKENDALRKHFTDEQNK